MSARHSPHGECGLKYPDRPDHHERDGSLPAWGVRVEIKTFVPVGVEITSLPAWGVRVEIRRTA